MTSLRGVGDTSEIYSPRDLQPVMEAKLTSGYRSRNMTKQDEPKMLSNVRMNTT